jgi:hypothetical protein
MKYPILFVCINMIFTSCDSYVDRTFEIFNESLHQVEVTAYSNRNLQHEGISKNRGSVLSFSASFDPEAETISLFVGDSLNFIFDDSLVLVHYSTTRPTIIDSPSFDKNISFQDIWTKGSNEYWTFEVTNEMYEEAVPLED